MFYILHGDDELGRSEALGRFRAELATAVGDMAELNTTTLDGSKLTMGELRHVSDSIPFMGDRRLVIVEGLLSRLAPRGKTRGQEHSETEEPAWKQDFVQELGDYLPAIPETTRIVFLETKIIPASAPILKAAKSHEWAGKGYIKLFKVPKDHELPGWIRERTKKKGGTITNEAIVLLAALVGDHLRLLDQELEKLLQYTDGQPIDAQDARKLVSRAREMSIFDLVDAVGRRQADRALKLIHAMLDDGAAPLYLLSMLARQIRILIQVSELRDQGLGQGQIAAKLKLHPYVAEKGLKQARNFTRQQLEAAHKHLVETDWAIKTGRMEDVLALDLLVVELSRA